MEAAKAVDAVSCFPGNDGEQADAEQAYIQASADDRDVETCVRIPKEYLPKEWTQKGYVDPVIKLRKALYGHPDSGGLWERHCESQLA